MSGAIAHVAGFADVDARIARDWWTPDVLADVSDFGLCGDCSGVNSAFIGGERYQETTWGKAIEHCASPSVAGPCHRIAQYHGGREVCSKVLLSRSCAFDEASREETGGRSERGVHAEGDLTGPRETKTVLSSQDGSEGGTHC